MKKLGLGIILISAILVTGCKNGENTNVKINSFNDSVSYAIGNDIAKSFERSEIDTIVNVDILVKAMKDRKLKDESVLDSAAVASVLMKFQMKMREAQEAKRLAENKIKFKDNLEEGEKFLSENKSKEGVVTTASGLQYKVLKEGTGATPVATDKVKVHYEGKLLDGKVFDSSYDRKKPSEFGVTQVIKGWTEALQLMKEGSIYELYIPYDLAYGERGSASIKPFSVLIFKVELLSIIKPEDKK